MTRKTLFLGLILVALVMAACGGKPPQGAEGQEPARQAPSAPPAQKEAPPPSAAEGDEKTKKSSVQSSTPESKKDKAPRDLKGAQVRTNSASSSKQTAPKAPAAQPHEMHKPDLIPSDITETEQELFLKYHDAYTTPSAFNGPIEDVSKFLEIMLKAESPYQLRWFVEQTMSQGEVLLIFDGDMGTAVNVLSADQACQNENACFDLILRVYDKARGRDKETLMNIAMAMKRFEFERGKRVEILRDLAKDPDQNVRLETAASFLALGLHDEGLPLLEHLAREGRTYALPYLFKSGWGKGPWEFWDERGLDILKRAIDFPIDEIRAEAAIFLAELGVEEIKAQQVALGTIKKYKNSKASHFGLSDDHFPAGPRTPDTENKLDQYSSASRACDYAMQAIGILNVREVIPILKGIAANNTEWCYVCDNQTASKILGRLQKEVSK